MKQQDRAGEPGSAIDPQSIPRQATTKAALTPARRPLVELMQEVNFGRIERLEVTRPIFCTNRSESLHRSLGL